ncbi:MAG: sigma-54 dependent transcriptional regulator [Thermodesulfobacteriota bacterium]
MPIKSVLIAHSDSDTARVIESALIERGVGAAHISDGANALEYLQKRPTTRIITEWDLPQVSGLEVLNHVSVKYPGARVIVTSPDQLARTAARLMRAGAFDYLTEPIEPGELAVCLDRFLTDDLPGENNGQFVRIPGRYDHIVGQSPAIRDVFRLVDKVATTDSTIMIYGESGTGKELIARAIHKSSRRRDKPLIPVNCGAIPEELLESELFGHEKGAFTSAIRTRIGRFELADGGTIFLDEIADMSPKLQVKLLRVLQEHEFERIGGGKTINVDIRVITATNKDLSQAVEHGRFREDLYYRLNVIPITVPPLRERKTDIPLLVQHFLSRFRETRDSIVVEIHPEAMEYIIKYSWPGNIRELENIIERMVILAEGPLLSKMDLPPKIAATAAFRSSSVGPEIKITEEGIDFNQVVSDFEDRLIHQALTMAGGVKNKAAQLLRLNRTTLVEKMKKKGMI